MAHAPAVEHGWAEMRRHAQVRDCRHRPLCTAAFLTVRLPRPPACRFFLLSFLSFFPAQERLDKKMSGLVTTVAKTEIPAFRWGWGGGVGGGAVPGVGGGSGSGAGGGRGRVRGARGLCGM